MDFSEILAQEINKKKEVIEKTKKLEHNGNGNKKFVKTSDLLDLQYEQTELENEAKEQQRLERLKRKASQYIHEDGNDGLSDSEDHDVDKRHDDEQHTKRQKLNETLINAQDELRSIGEPIRKYGETDDDVIKRLDGLKKGSHNKDEVNDTKEQDRVSDEKSQAETESEAKKQSIKEGHPKIGKDNDTNDLQPYSEKQSQLKLVIPDDLLINKDEIRDNLPKVTSQCRDYIKLLLAQWDETIHNSNRTSPTSITEEDSKLILTETKKWLISLLVLLKKQKLPANSTITLSTILYNLQNKDYQHANENYINLSVGNVAWPIGVINVGIHERSAHARLTGDGADNVSNIMKDEKTRRWLLGLKRLISFCERVDS
ncbi:unnamed protein product [Ambrosiozyma monospora]|uniref:Pre-mRNA-splicing factor 18 n=1 Tax=Ambrosiozyma monospora TaxID=43982 RepID=A0A9W6YTK5_AMBMO|nr:unnamed protein product [Ambrosiozyma monospora]